MLAVLGVMGQTLDGAKRAIDSSLSSIFGETAEVWSSRRTRAYTANGKGTCKLSGHVSEMLLRVDIYSVRTSWMSTEDASSHASWRKVLTKGSGAVTEN